LGGVEKMELLQAVLGAVYQLFIMELNIFGFSLSFLQIAIYSVVAYIIFSFIGGLLDDN
jgi:hypothetical protein